MANDKHELGIELTYNTNSIRMELYLVCATCGHCHPFGSRYASLIQIQQAVEAHINETPTRTLETGNW